MSYSIVVMTMVLNWYLMTVLFMLAITAAVFLAVVVLFMILFKEDMKGILQNLLYTKEELEIMQKWAAQ